MTNDNTEDDTFPTDRRPLGYWLRVVDGLISREFASAFAEQDVTRRDWMLLNALSGEVDAPWLADVLARRGKRLRRLAERGWVAETDGGWELTDEGRAAQARLSELVQGVRAKVAGAVSPEDFATLTASLEAIARELGWDENERMPRGSRFGRGRGPRGEGFVPGFRGFGPRFGPGFGPRRFGHGFGSGAYEAEERAEWAERHGAHAGHRFDPRFAAAADCGHHGAHPHHRHGDGHQAEHAYERGFEAGFRAANRGGTASDSAA